MPKAAPPKSKPARRAKAQDAEHVHANRVAAHLDPTMYAAPKLAETVKEEAERVSAAVNETAHGAVEKIEKAAAPMVDWFGEGFSRVASAIEGAQELARESLKTFTTSRADTTTQAVVIQQKLMSMTQANVAQSIAAVQKLMSAGNVNQAMAIHSEYSRNAIKTLTDQAKELQALSAKLAEGAGKPITAHWSKAAEMLSGKAS